jgi:adenylosuccinate synthase
MAQINLVNGNLTVVGAQWGDEGKGKIVDWLAARTRADAVVRFNGGNNAGHTLVAGGRTCKVSLVPSGVLAATPGIIANGVVLNPFALVDEIDRLGREGIAVTRDTLCVAENAALLLPCHEAVDRAREAANGGLLGTTGRGIGPACEDKVGRRAVRVGDLADETVLRERVPALLDHNNALLRHYGAPPFDADETIAGLLEVRTRILPFAERVTDRLSRTLRGRGRLIFEGAQSVLLDIDHGTYPFVTSSSCVAGSVAAGCGVRPAAIGTVFGVTKAYATRVGTGPFPTELHDEVGHMLRARGHEFGTVTARPRRCGWLDAALLRQACHLGGIDRLMVTKLDILDGLSELKIATGYRIDGRDYDHLPAGLPQQASATPVYETLPGWTTPTAAMRTWGELPGEAVRYVARIEELTGLPVAAVSVGADRDATIAVTRSTGRGIHRRTFNR